ncbi:MAG: aconitate hydratase AcnA [Pedobacter sp.]|uniref:aconitate hydratase AcnA n=1 Tax=Pedobacter sp. TaxID=1411316 RepID=UPI00339A26D8
MTNVTYQRVETLSGRYGSYSYYSLRSLNDAGFPVECLPFSVRILLENAIRNFDGFAITNEHIASLINWSPGGGSRDIPFKPARVLMQDFTGVPAVVDIASLRAEMARKGKDPDLINPLIPVDLVIDHSVQVDYFGTDYAYEQNIAEEYSRNKERYEFLKWAQGSFDNFSVVPPGMGICHQVNLEYLAKGIVTRNQLAFPDSLVGTDSHTPMVNGIGVLGWGVGGIEAEAALLGQPIYFLMPQVVGLKLSGRLSPGVSGTDLVLTITRLLRDHGVIGKFVEVFGSGLESLSVPDRASIGNMSPEFGCTVTYFPIDSKTLDYMRSTGRTEEQIELTEDYCKANMLWRSGEDKILYSTLVELDLGTVKTTVSGPKRPQDKILLKDFRARFINILKESYGREYLPPAMLERWQGEGGSQPASAAQPGNQDMTIETLKGKDQKQVWLNMGREKYMLNDGSIVIAAITSCTNTSNPYLMIAAGLVARKARQRGVGTKPWVKTSLAPGSKVVTDYLSRAGLLGDLQALNFHTVGYGCTSCIGNSGPLPEHISMAIEDNDLVVASVLSGNRNFEARIHPQVKMNFLMSPMLVVAYAIAGRVDIDLEAEPLAYDPNGNGVFYHDLMPDGKEVYQMMETALSKNDYWKNYAEIFAGNATWQNLRVPEGQLYSWDAESTYIKESPFFKDLAEEVPEVRAVSNARVLLMLGDSITTDHISPAGSFREDSAAGLYLSGLGIQKANYNSYGSRRGNDEVMIRGTFANVRIRNALSDREGGYTRFHPTAEQMSVFDASVRYRAANTPLMVLAGREYGSGSSRDWAAKGTFLLGIRLVLAESYERIHRSNLVGMGVMPIEYLPGESAVTLGLDGTESFSLGGYENGITPGMELDLKVLSANGLEKSFRVICRLDSNIEIEYYKNGGILQYVMRQFLHR